MWLVEENTNHGVLFFWGTPASAEEGHSAGKKSSALPALPSSRQ